MAIPFMTAEWAKAFMDAINSNDAYKEAAATWEGDFYFIAEMKDGSSATVYLDLWHGACRDAYLVPDASTKSPEFEVSGKIPSWKKVIGKQVDPIQALITRQLKLKGNMAKVLRAVKAAQELVNSATRVPTEFPE
jgi:putative sterol carrier protein